MCAKENNVSRLTEQAKLTKAEANLTEAKDACAAAKAHLNSILDPQASHVWWRGEQWENVWQPLAGTILFIMGLVFSSLRCPRCHSGV
jgi:hypothetical protein